MENINEESKKQTTTNEKQLKQFENKIKKTKRKPIQATTTIEKTKTKNNEHQ